MSKFRVPMVSGLVGICAVSSALAGAGNLTANVAPLSERVTYAIPGSTGLNTYVGYLVSFKNDSPNTVNKVTFRFTLDGNSSQMALFDKTTYLPDGCLAVPLSNSFECTLTQMRSQEMFPPDGSQFVVLYSAPPAPSTNDDTTVTTSVRAIYAEGLAGANGASNSNIPIGGESSVTLGTVNDRTIRTAVPKGGGSLRTGSAGVPTTDNKATELINLPALVGTTYATANVVVDVSATDNASTTSDPNCLTQGRFHQCPVYTTDIPTPGDSATPLPFTADRPLQLTYRVHPSNLKLSESKTLNSVLIRYSASITSPMFETIAVSNMCPTATTADTTGKPCVASPPFCYKRNTANWTPALDGVCEFRFNNTKNGLLKLE